MNPIARKKVLVFGALGAVGCLLGWAAGEALLAAGLPDRGEEKAAPSLASPPEALPKPEPPKLDRPTATAPPRPKAPEIVKRDAPKPAAPNTVISNSPRRVAPPLPPDFQKRLDLAGGKSGQLQFTLIWNNRNDLDLHCIDPNGEEIFYSHKKAIKGSGGHLDVDRNVSGETSTPVENIYFPSGAPLGRYRVFVKHYSNKGNPDPTEYELSALVEDRRSGFRGKVSDGDPKQPVGEFDLPGVRLAVPPEVTLYPGVSNRFRVRLERDKRNAAPVRLTFAGESAGLTLPEGVTVPENRDDAEVKVSAAPTAVPGARKVRVVADGKFGKTEAEFKVAVVPTPATVQLALPAEVVVYPGGKNRLHVALIRHNHDGPVALSLAGETNGLTVSEPVTVAGGRSEGVFEVSAARTAAAGPRVLKVVAKGKHGEVEEPCRVAVTIPPAALQIVAAKSVAIRPGGEATVTVLVARDWYEGPVKVRGTSPNAGVAAWDATVPADRDSVELKVTAFETAKEGTAPLALTAVGGTARAETETALEIALPPPPPAPPNAPRAAWSWRLVLVIGLWTALLAIGLSLALVAGQNRYLGRAWLSGRQAGLILAGGGAAGLVAGAIGQALFGLLARGGVPPEVGFLAGWLLLGGLLGRGIAFFIPNLHPWRAALAGAAGGLFGAVAFILISRLGDAPGRFVGAALLGGCIGLMVALVELAFRSAWLEVRYSEREVVTVNLGPEPVKIGGDGRTCTVWARGAADVALRFWIRDGKVVCEDAVNRTTSEVTNGDRRRAGSLEVIVRTGSGAANERVAPKPAAPPEPRKKPSSDDDDSLPLPMPSAARPIPPRPAAKPVDDDFDSLPLPASPPARPTAPPKPPVPTRAMNIPCPRCKAKLALGSRRCPECGASW